MRTRSIVVSIAAAASAAAVLTGCTAADGAAPSTSGTPAKNAAVSSAIPTIPAGSGIISATTMSHCDTTGTKVTAKGSVAMPSGKSGDVVVSVSWVDSKTSTVYGRGVTTLAGLDSGQKKDWTTSATLPASAESVACVLGAVVTK